MRYSPAEHDAFARAFNRDSLVVLHDHLPRDKLQRWREAFEPLFGGQVCRKLLRFNPVVPDEQVEQQTESYRVFAY